MFRSTVKWSLVAVGIAGLGMVAWAQDGHTGHVVAVTPQHPGHEAPATQPAKTDSPARSLADLEVLLQSAQKAAQAGDAKAAAAELAKAQKVLAALKEQLSAPPPAHSGRPVNTQCPMMGGKVDPGKTPPELTRAFQGQTIGFCCAGCPPAWDKLSDEQKQAKLAPPQGHGH